MDRLIKQGKTDARVRFCVVDNTTGLRKTGLAYNATGIAVWYQRVAGNKTAITLAAGTGLTADHSDGKWNEIGDGWYQCDSVDAAFAAGSNSVKFGGSATGYTFFGENVNLVAFDPDDAVRLGLTALPNAAADAAGGLPISDAGGLNMDGLATAAGVPTAAAVADAVWDEATSGHASAGTFGLQLGSLSTPNVVGVVGSRVDQTNIDTFVGETYTATISTVDADGNAVDISGNTLVIIIEGKSKTDITTIADGSITKTSTTIAFAISSTVNDSEKQVYWSCRNNSTKQVYLHGVITVRHAAKADA